MRVYPRGQVFWLDGRDAAGRRARFSTRLNDEAAAMKFALDWKLQQERAGVGLPPPPTAPEPKTTTLITPIESALGEWLTEMRRLGRDDVYLDNAARAVRAMAAGAGWLDMTQINPRDIARHFGELAAGELHPLTINTRRSQISSWLGWCWKVAKLCNCNPVELVPPCRVPDRKARRALSAEEITTLARTSADRGWVYVVLALTGLRRGEATELRWKHVVLEGPEPRLALEDWMTKSRRAETIPLVADVARLLGARRADGGPDDRVMPVPDRLKFNDDLKAAGINKRTPDGVAVLHSLRHSLCTMLMRAGVPVQHAQKIMRHRNIQLTLKVYTTDGLLGLGESMSRLPSLASAAGL